MTNRQAFTKCAFGLHKSIRPSLLAGMAACSLVFVGACQQKGSAEASTAQQVAQAQAPSPATVPDVAETAPQATPAPARSKVDTAAPKPQDAAAGKAISIAGGWVNAGGACDSGASVFFNPDGTYMSEGEKGTWDLSGKTLTVTTATTFDEASSTMQGPDESTGEVGEKSVLTLLSVTDDAARVVLSNGSNASWTRCTS